MRRGAQAALLYLAGLGLPLAGWFHAGWSEARREERVRLEQVRVEAEQALQRGVERADARLEALRSAEDRRPYFHYQNLYHDPQGASLGPSVLPSPLAEGPGDPLIEGYFQIDEARRLSLPTLNDELGGASGAPAGVLEQQRALRTLLQAHVEHLATLEPARPETERPAPDPKDEELRGGMLLSSPQRKAPPSKARASSLEPREQQIAVDSYAQNMQANRIFQDLKNARKPTYEVPRNYGDNVGISTEPLRWSVTSLAGAYRVLALRRANTPDGKLRQGFLLRTEELQATLGLPQATILELAPVEDDSRVAVPLGGTGLWVQLDHERETWQAVAEARGRWHRFLGLFSLAALVVAGAGALVVLLVERTERLAQERSRFAASAAHELRTPLAGLRMYADMLAEGLGDPARHDDYARRISLEAERLGRVVGNVLGFTRLEQSALVVKPRRGDLGSFVEEVVLRLMPWAEAMGVTLDLSVATTPPVAFDGDAVTQVLQNLIDNAEKYGRSGADRSVLVEVQGREGGVELAVIDRGPGVPPSLRGRLFSPFARSPSPDDPPGLGLGLSLARALVEAHGGRLVHEPTDGGGATFRAWFPGEPGAPRG